MKLLALLLLVTTFAHASSTPETVEKELKRIEETYKKRADAGAAKLKLVNAEFCKKGVSVACKAQAGQQVSGEEMYDSKEIAELKTAEAKMNTCGEDLKCKMKRADEFTVSWINKQAAKCKTGDKKACYSQKLFEGVKEMNDINRSMGDDIAKLKK